jgi:putative hydrolase of the HAD superfamily
VQRSSGPGASGIKAVCFDFGQTLVDSAQGFRTAEKKAQQAVFRQSGLSDWDAFLDVYRTTRKSMHEQSRFSRRAIWSAVLEALGRQPDRAFLEGLEQEYWQTVQRLTRPFPEAESVLSALSGRYRLGLITNTQGESAPEQHRIHHFPRLKAFFQCLVVAGQEGIPAKPDRAPFEQALQELAVVPQAAVYVGDDYRIDILGSEAAGLQPVWLKHRLVERRWPAVRSEAPVIETLEPLCRLEELL